MSKPAIPQDVEDGCFEVRQLLNRLEHKAAAIKSEALTKAHPKSFAAWAARGAVLYELGKLDEAATAYTHARSYAEQSFGGTLPKRLRWADSAERHVLRAIHGLGLVAYRRGNNEAAKTYFEEEVRLNPADEQAAKYLLRDIQAGRPWKALGKQGDA